MAKSISQVVFFRNSSFLFSLYYSYFKFTNMLKTEFLIAISVTSQGDVKQKLSMAFKMYDLDKNGRVEKKEMEKIIEAIYDLLGKRL